MAFRQPDVDVLSPHRREMLVAPIRRTGLLRGSGSLAPTLLTHFYLQVFVSLVPTKSKFGLSSTYKGGVGWGGDDNVQVRSKTDLSIDKTKGWGGVGWG